VKGPWSKITFGYFCFFFVQPPSDSFFKQSLFDRGGFVCYRVEMGILINLVEGFHTFRKGKRIPMAIIPKGVTHSFYLDADINGIMAAFRAGAVFSPLREEHRPQRREPFFIGSPKMMRLSPNPRILWMGGGGLKSWRLKTY
jgi:hypothetical protein